MPVYDYECSFCGHIHERIEGIEKTLAVCPKCKGLAKRIISASGVFTANEDAPWIRSILDVVDKDSTAPHVVEFRKNPTRVNYKKWMKGEGLRHAEDGERMPTEKDNIKEITDSIMKRRYERRAISL